MYLEKFRLDRKTALVTGAGQGIGLACAEALAEAGAKVVIADRDAKLAETGCARLKAKGLDTEIVIMDVTDSGRVSEVADQLASRYGGIDILVNNAGIARSETPAEQVTDEHWLNVIDVNLNGTFWCCRAFGKHMATHIESIDVVFFAQASQLILELHRGLRPTGNHNQRTARARLQIVQLDAVISREPSLLEGRFGGDC